MQDDTVSILTQEELDFIRSLQDAPQVPTTRSQLLILEGGDRTKKLLTQLASEEQLTIEAHIDNQRITFPVRVVTDEHEGLHLQLGAPTIVEQHVADRPWRLHFEPPVNLIDAVGKSTSMWLHELSQSGLLVELRERKQAPEHLALWLPVDGQQPLELTGNLVRKTSEGLYAYRQTLRKSRSIERLRAYLLDQLQRLRHSQAAN
ncbi:hypothetical protein [Zestomonas thermotolerans]|uniref:hypothetical protein n=1 Tax=Zestomonas thermotolerans TaxID=157784 RepID=UPI00048739E0|nr:hypothetical protein [Pseudomonas thermotolerans]